MQFLVFLHLRYLADFLHSVKLPVSLVIFLIHSTMRLGNGKYFVKEDLFIQIQLQL